MTDFNAIYESSKSEYVTALEGLYTASVKLQAAAFCADSAGSSARGSNFSAIPAFRGFNGTPKLSADADGTRCHAYPETIRADINAEIERLKAL